MSKYANADNASISLHSLPNSLEDQESKRRVKIAFSVYYKGKDGGAATNKNWDFYWDFNKEERE
jgi:hypothetical protein